MFFILSKWFFICVAVIFLTACAHEQYEEKPIYSSEVSKKISNKSTTSDDFNAFLLKRGYSPNALPIKNWTLDELTLSAIFHHADIAIAKEKLILAEKKLQAAGLNQSIGINPQIARSNQANGDINPWAYFLVLDIPITTQNKKNIQIEQAQQEVEIARLNIAEQAWQLRQNIAEDLLNLYQIQSEVKSLNAEVELHQSILSQIEKRVDKGFASSVDATKVKILLNRSKASLNHQKSLIAPLLKKIGNDAGVPGQALSETEITPINIDENIKLHDGYLSQPSSSSDLKRTMLLNRLDIRRGLLEYAVAESTLKLEVAKQTPDITLSPGIAYEFGDTVWSLGINSLINLLKNNHVLIEQAKQLREIEATRFESLQAKVIGDLSQAYAGFMAAKENYLAQQDNHRHELNHLKKIESQLKAGLIDKPTFTQAQLNLNASQQSLNNTKFTLLSAMLTIENLLQIPFNEVVSNEAL